MWTPPSRHLLLSPLDVRIKRASPLIGSSVLKVRSTAWAVRLYSIHPKSSSLQCPTFLLSFRNTSLHSFLRHLLCAWQFVLVSVRFTSFFYQLLNDGPISVLCRTCFSSHKVPSAHATPACCKCTKTSTCTAYGDGCWGAALGACSASD